MNKRAFVSIS